jgi:hypothetical protein
MVLPPPAPPTATLRGNIDFAKSAEENIKDLTAYLEQGYRIEGGSQVAFKSAADFRADAFDLYHKRLDAVNASYTAGQHDADYEDHLDHLGHCDSLPPPTPCVPDDNDFDGRERERLSFTLAPSQAFWTRRLWEVSDFPENRQAWLGGDGGATNRRLRLNNCADYVNALASIGISETPLGPKMITVGPNPFPEYQGEALSWSVGLYMTTDESRDGYPRARTVAKALKAFRPATFEREKLEALKATFGMFSTNAKTALRIYEEA